jgi:hypothetical protein
MRATPPRQEPPHLPDGGTIELDDLAADQSYRNAIDKNVPVNWNLFHRPGDILFTAENTPESLSVRSLQAGLRSQECMTRGAYPRFSHVLMCVMPGLFIESSPVSWWRDHDKPAVKFVRAEDFPGSRSDFLVLRHRELGTDQDFGVKMLLRSIFHGGKPYHFYLLGDHQDRVFCSELVATIYNDAGTRLKADRDCRHTLPFDLEGLESLDGWSNATKLYLAAEDLCSRGLIKNAARDLRDTHLGQYESSSDMAENLTRLNEAAIDFAKDYDSQMSRPVELAAGEPPPTYVANIKELLAILKKHYPTYLQIRRYAIDGPSPERMRFNSVEAAELIRNLNAVADKLTDLAKMTISVVATGFRTECERYLALATDAARALSDDLTPEARKAHADKLSERISWIERFQPESERDSGLEVLAEVVQLMEAMEWVDPPPDADPQIMTAFTLCAMMLHVLAIQVKGTFFGAALFKLVHTVSEAWDGSPEMNAAIAETRDSLREQMADRSALFEKLLAGMKRERDDSDA